MKFTRSNRPAMLLVGTSALVFAFTAQAQTSALELEEVVVTGSRVITNGNDSPTPVTVVDAQALLAVNPGTISEALNSLPVFSGSNGPTSNPNVGIGAGGGGNGARSGLNLRNLGEARTLVLMDGHRVPSTTSTNVVDSDMIPQLMIKRVDVVTGGLSAVYGSDAITGVINFITDRDFNGVKAEAKYGLSEQSDGQQYSFGVAAGTRLGDRAHIEGSYEFHDDEGIAFRSSRPNNHLCGMLGNSSPIPYFLTCNVKRNDATFGGLIRTGAGTFNNQQFTAPGVLAPFVAGAGAAVTGNAALGIGGDGAYLDGSLKASLRSHQIFGRFDYDFTDDLHGYVEVAGNKKTNGFSAGWLNVGGTGGVLSRDNAYLPAAVRAQVPVTPGTFTFGKLVNSTDTRIKPVVEETQLFVMSGLEGKLGSYDWTLGFVHGNAELDDVHNNNVNNFRLSAAMDAVVNSSGQTVCNVTITNPTAFPGCVPINVFGPGSESPQALAYVLGNTTYVATTKQDEVSGSITGKPFDTWAGPFGVALSGEWRKQSFSSVSGMPPLDPTRPTNCAAMGLRYNCGATTSEWATTFANRSEVSQTVKEVAVEAVAPLLVDVPMVKALNLNGAVRYTSYDTTGEYTTWKVGLDWNINDSWRVRGTKSRDIRAPTLNDLFAPSVGTQQTNIADLLLGGNAPNAPRFEYGNPNLTAEIGRTMTLGIVWQPESVQGLSVSVDGYDIELSNAIVALSGTDQAVQRSCYDSGGASPYCALQTRTLGVGNITRVPTNTIVSWATTVYNIANIHTWGGDLEVNYSTRLGSHPLLAACLVYLSAAHQVCPAEPVHSRPGWRLLWLRRPAGQPVESCDAAGSLWVHG